MPDVFQFIGRSPVRPEAISWHHFAPRPRLLFKGFSSGNIWQSTFVGCGAIHADYVGHGAFHIFAPCDFGVWRDGWTSAIGTDTR